VVLVLFPVTIFVWTYHPIHVCVAHYAVIKYIASSSNSLIFIMRAAILTLLPFVLPLSQKCLAFTSPVSHLRVGQGSVPALEAFRLETTSSDEGLPSTNTFLDPIADGITDLSILGLRLGTCVLMVHHGIDKLDHVEGFSVNVVAKFFGFLPGDPAFWTISAAATQIAGAGLLAVGILARPVALSMMATMVTAVVFHLLNTGIEGFPLGVPAAHSYNFELAAMYVAVLAYFSAAGAGAYSIDEKVFGGELKLYESLFEKVTAKRE